jgi:glucose-1-phosphate thymidylyltransferase
MKGVLLGGGFGSRMRPFTKRLNKGLAPIYTPKGAIPQLCFPLQTLTSSGITEILIITSQDHCGHIVELFGDGEEYNCKLTYRIQNMYPKDEIVGIAQALKLAEGFVGSDDFAVILGDNYYENSFKIEFDNFQADPNIDKAAIFLKSVHDVQRFGCATIDADGNVKKIVEKPESPESDLAVTGLYLYSSTVFSLLPSLKPSRRKELEITDVNQHYATTNCLKSYKLSGMWSDMGLPESALLVSNVLSKNA